VSGPGSIVEGGTLAEWFDVIVHTQTVNPATASSPVSTRGLGPLR
jgi:hypothetical protein